MYDVRLLLLEDTAESGTAVGQTYVGTLAHTFGQQYDVTPYQLIGLGIDMQDFHGLSRLKGLSGGDQQGGGTASEQVAEEDAEALAKESGPGYLLFEIL